MSVMHIKNGDGGTWKRTHYRHARINCCCGKVFYGSGTETFLRKISVDDMTVFFKLKKLFIYKNEKFKKWKITCEGAQTCILLISGRLTQ